MPIVSVTKNSHNLDYGGMFQPTTRTIELAIDYCGTTVPDSLTLVIDDLELLNWAVVVGRPLGQPPTGTGPGVYNQFELGWAADQTATEPLIRPYIVQSYRGALDPGSNHVWRVSIQISLMVRNINYTEDYIGRNHSAVSITSNSRSVRAYRIGKLVEHSGTAASTGELMLPEMEWDGTDGRFTNTWITCGADDIGGDPLDINGEPLTMPIEQTSITLSFVIREPYYASYSAATRTTNAMWESWGKNPRTHVNKRNSSVLFGYAIGRLVVMSVNVTRIDMEFRRVDITLVDDEWYHFDQMPWSTVGVVPKLDTGCAGEAEEGDLVTWNCKYVLWVTPIVEGFNWSTIDFPDDVYSFFTEAVTVT